MEAFLPPAKGYLPYYMLGLSIISIGNSLQNYITLHYTRRMYNGLFTPNITLPSQTSSYDPQDATNKLLPCTTTTASTSKRDDDANAPQDQVTPLAARLFGTYTFVVSIVRLYAAYNLHLAPMYQLGIWTYVVAWVHFVSELWVFKTQRLGKPQLLPLGFATFGIFWMGSQYGFYVEA